MGIDKIISAQHGSVADPHLQIRGGGVEGGSHPDPEIAAGPVSKNFLQPFGPQCDLKIRESAGTPGTPLLDPPLQTTISILSTVENYSVANKMRQQMLRK